MDMEEQFLRQLPLIERIARHTARHHNCRSDEAEDFLSTVKLRLIADDYGVLRKFQEHSSLSTFLTTVIQRLMIDYRNHAWGKWRPSASARRLGLVAERIECLMSRDGHTLDEACEILRTNHRIGVTADELRNVAARLTPRARRTLVEDAGVEALPAADDRPDSWLLDREREDARGRVAESLARVLQRLGDEDRLIVRLRVEDGMQVSAIARFLGFEAKPFYRRLGGIFAALRRALEQEGVGPELVAEALMDPPAASSSLVGRMPV
jgi:RNA polymerase sigma factor (sigma-70 family)